MANQPVAHFRSGFTCKSDRDHFFRVFNMCQQAKHTLGQELGFTGAGRGLDNVGVV